MVVCDRQPLAEGTGVRRELESVGSWKQNSSPRNTSHFRHNCWDETPIHVKVQRLHRQRDVNIAGSLSDGELTYHRRSDRRLKTKYESLTHFY
jgi:hypothetical protein